VAGFLIGARGAGEPMISMRSAFPNSNALLDHMQKQHIAGIQRIEGLAALAGLSGTSSIISSGKSSSKRDKNPLSEYKERKLIAKNMGWTLDEVATFFCPHGAGSLCRRCHPGKKY